MFTCAKLLSRVGEIVLLNPFHFLRLFKIVSSCPWLPLLSLIQGERGWMSWQKVLHSIHGGIIMCHWYNSAGCTMGTRVLWCTSGTMVLCVRLVQWLLFVPLAQWSTIVSYVPLVQ